MNSFRKKKYTHIDRDVALAFIILLTPFFLFSQNNASPNSKLTDQESDNRLINQFISSKGSNIILFDASNIKQFWIDNSVVSRENDIVIRLNQSQNGKESNPLKIQLANVSIFQDCKIEVVSEMSDYSFSITNSKSEILSSSAQEDSFIHYSVFSSTFHLEDADHYSFNMKFSSKKNDILTIKKIILTFPQSTDYLSSPGKLRITPDILTRVNARVSAIDDSTFALSGTWFDVFSKKKIYVSSNTISYSLKAKNTGNEATRIYVGFAPYTKDGKRINITNNLYKGNIIMKVLSSEANSSKIIVDKYPEWKNGCFLALNAQEDFSDFPNFSLIEESITNVKKIDDSKTEITFAKPLKDAIAIGTSVRVQSPVGSNYLYMNVADLKPGEEVTLSSIVKKDDDCLEFSPAAFCRGTYYVVPLLLSHSSDPQKETTVQISNFVISY